MVNFSRPVCDRRFAERNAEVVCKQLGYDMLNVYLDFDQRIEYDALSLTRIIYWVCSVVILNFCNFDDAILISIFSPSLNHCSAQEKRRGCRTVPCE